MQSQDGNKDDTCNPIWVHLNHLFSYCSKRAPTAASLPVADSGAPSIDSRCCTRGNCLFRFNKQ